MKDPVFVTCGVCGSSRVEEVSREPISTKHYTDHRIKYRCLDCGNFTERG